MNIIFKVAVIAGIGFLCSGKVSADMGDIGKRFPGSCIGGIFIDNSCGGSDELNSFKTDGGYLLAIPYVLWKSPELKWHTPVALLVSPFAMVLGALGLAGDSIMAIPNLIAHHLGH